MLSIGKKCLGLCEYTPELIIKIDGNEREERVFRVRDLVGRKMGRR